MKQFKNLLSIHYNPDKLLTFIEKSAIECCEADDQMVPSIGAESLLGVDSPTPFFISKFKH